MEEVSFKNKKRMFLKPPSHLGGNIRQRFAVKAPWFFFQNHVKNVVDGGTSVLLTPIVLVQASIKTSHPFSRETETQPSISFYIINRWP